MNEIYKYIIEKHPNMIDKIFDDTNVIYRIISMDEMNSNGDFLDMIVDKYGDDISDDYYCDIAGYIWKSKKLKKITLEKIINSKNYWKYDIRYCHTMTKMIAAKLLLELYNAGKFIKGNMANYPWIYGNYFNIDENTLIYLAKECKNEEELINRIENAQLLK